MIHHLKRERDETYVEAFIRTMQSIWSREPEILARKFETTVKEIEKKQNDYIEFQSFLNSYRNLYLKKLSEIAQKNATAEYANLFVTAYADIFGDSPTKQEKNIKKSVATELRKVMEVLEKARKEQQQQKKMETIEKVFSDSPKELDEKDEKIVLKKKHLCSQFFYRGQARSGLPLLPSVFRPDISKDESFYYQEMLRLEPHAFSGNSVFDNLALMQHYGCPTRLLDVTFNPLVSLYFACSAETGTDGEVYVFNRLDFAHSDDSAVNALSKIALLNPSEKREFAKDLKNNTLSETRPYGRVLKGYELERVFFVEPILVKPKFIAPRIKQQAGAFAIAPFGNCDLGGEMSSICCEQIVIPAKAKEYIIRELDQLCINEAYLFDGLEHIANYLNISQ